VLTGRCYVVDFESQSDLNIRIGDETMKRTRDEGKEGAKRKRNY